MDVAPDAGTNAATAALSEPVVPPQPTMPHSIPIEPQLRMCLHNGFWVPEKLLTDIPVIHARFKPRASDIFLASHPKSGTTWLKALAYATLNRGTRSPFDMEHPLRRRNPHDCVGFIDMDMDSVFRSNVETSTVLDELEALPSPRLLATHLPYSLLPEGITTGDEALGSRIVYICRNPKDVLVSQWFFNKKLPPTCNTEARRRSLHEEFELFCDGRSFLGPQWQHVLQYWKESLRRPDKVLFLRYEEMLREPSRNLVKLAEFMGCAFSEEEEEKGGVVDAIVELCGLSKLKSVEVNKSGSNYLAMKNEAYFRKGVVGDWSNHLTPDMARKLDKIVEDALQGSGLDLSSSIASD